MAAHDACGNKRHPMRDAERIAGRVVRFVVLGQQDGDEHVVAETVAKFGDDLLAGDLPRFGWARRRGLIELLFYGA
jgi:hypothetical protein